MFGQFQSRESRKLFLYFIAVLLLALALIFVAFLFRLFLELRLLGPERSLSLKGFALYLALWEGVLAVSVSYAFYRLFAAYERYRMETEEFLKLLVTTLSHRFGNFLSAQKVNLEILKNSPSPEAVARLKEACRAMERDLEGLLRFLRGWFEETPPPGGDFAGHLKELVRRLELQFGPRKVHLSLRDAPPPPSPELELLLLLLLENAFRHSHKKIWIRIGRREGRSYILIMNDLSPHPVKGAGLGLYLARRLAGHYGLRLRIESQRSRFWVLLLHAG